MSWFFFGRPFPVVPFWLPEMFTKIIPSGNYFFGIFEGVRTLKIYGRGLFQGITYEIRNFSKTIISE